MQSLQYGYAILNGEKILRSRLSYRLYPAPRWNFFFATCLILLERKKYIFLFFKGQCLSGEKIILSNIRRTITLFIYIKHCSRILDLK